MSSSWLLHERGRLGEEGKVWELSKATPLRVGRSGDCDIVFQTQTVEPCHAEILWNNKLSTFMVRDLGSVNGTYINNTPLRGNSASLSHNDALRFGYEKDRVFRIEEQCSSSKAQSAKKTISGSPLDHEPVLATSSSISASSSIAAPNVTSIHSSSHDLVGVVNGIGTRYSPAPSLPLQSYQSVPLQLTNQGYNYTSTPPPLTPVLSVVASTHSSSPGHVPLCSSPVPPGNYSYSTPNLLLAAGSGCQLGQDATSSSSYSSSSSHQIGLVSPSSSSSVEPKDLASSSAAAAVHRSDGRRAVSLEQSPSLNQASKLYGEPSWWGDKKGGGAYSIDKEYEFSKPGSQILRDIDHERARKEKEVTSLRLSVKDEMKLKNTTGSHSQDNDMPSSPPSSSWTIDFGGNNSGVNTLPRLMRSRDRVSRPRSADPSPNRLRGRRDVSPLPDRPVTPTSMSAANVKRRSSLNLSQNKPNPVSTPARPQLRQRAATPPVTACPLSPVRKSQGLSSSTAAPPTQSAAHKQRAATPPVKHASPVRRRANTTISRSSAVTSDKQVSKPAIKKKDISSSSTSKSPVHSPLPSKLSAKSMTTSPKHAPLAVSSNCKPMSVEKAESEGGEHTYVVGVSDDTSSLSSLSDPSFVSASESVVVVTPESAAAKQNTSKAAMKKAADSKEGVGGKDEKVFKGTSGRKQWIEDDTQPCADTLMMASIEGRMRRLSQLAHQTARQVTTLRSSLQEGRAMEVQALDYLTMRTSSPVMTKIEQSLPEWRCFNKEANSIFRNIRIVEKWLQDIDANLKCIRPVDGGNDTVDYFSNDSNEEDNQDSTT